MRGNNTYTLDGGDRFGDEFAAANSPAALRAGFIKRTYAHVFGAVLALIAIEAYLLGSGAAEPILKAIFASGGKATWIILMVAFVAAGYVAQYMARASSVPMQYLGLGGYVLLESVILLPILYQAQVMFPEKQLAAQAGIVTLLVFGSLTTFVFVSGKDFSFLGPVLTILSFAALGLVIGSVVFGFSLGLVFSVAMVVLVAGMIVYETSNIMHNYGVHQHVAASLALFASIATMFYYILRIFMSTSSRD